MHGKVNLRKICGGEIEPRRHINPSKKGKRGVDGCRYEHKLKGEGVFVTSVGEWEEIPKRAGVLNGEDH